MANIQHRGKVSFVVTFDLDAHTHAEGEPNDHIGDVIHRLKDRMEPEIRTRMMTGVSRVMSDQMAYERAAAIDLGIVGITVSEGVWSND